jgi:hypothetical protein
MCLFDVLLDHPDVSRNTFLPHHTVERVGKQREQAGCVSNARQVHFLETPTESSIASFQFRGRYGNGGRPSELPGTLPRF